MTRQRFMAMDLTIFSILAGLSEFLSNFLFNYFNSGYYISFAIMICIICIIRWSYYGIIPLLVSGIIDVLLSNSGLSIMSNDLGLLSNIFFYVIASIPILLVLFYTKLKDRDRSIDTNFKFFIYIILCFGLLVISKGVALLILEGSLSGFANYFISISLSLVITLIFLFIFKSKTDLIRDIDCYIKEVQAEDNYEREHIKTEV